LNLCYYTIFFSYVVVVSSTPPPSFLFFSRIACANYRALNPFNASSFKFSPFLCIDCSLLIVREPFPPPILIIPRRKMSHFIVTEVPFPNRQECGLVFIGLNAPCHPNSRQNLSIFPLSAPPPQSPFFIRYCPLKNLQWCAANFIVSLPFFLLKSHEDLFCP